MECLAAGGQVHEAIAARRELFRAFPGQAGQQAAAGRGAAFPLVEAGFTKADVRAASRRLGLRTWDKPAAACLSSRIARGETITVERLRRIEAAEAVLLDEGFRQVRVRDHGGHARVEVGQDELSRLIEPRMRDHVTSRLTALGFASVILDPAGYRPGSTNTPI